MSARETRGTQANLGFAGRSRGKQGKAREWDEAGAAGKQAKARENKESKGTQRKGEESRRKQGKAEESRGEQGQAGKAKESLEHRRAEPEKGAEFCVRRAQNTVRNKVS